MVDFKYSPTQLMSGAYIPTLESQQVLINNVIPNILAGLSHDYGYECVITYTDLQIVPSSYAGDKVYNVFCVVSVAENDTIQSSSRVWLAAVPRLDDDGLFTIDGHRYALAARQRLMPNVPICRYHNTAAKESLRCSMRSENMESLESTSMYISRSAKKPHRLMLALNIKNFSKQDLLGYLKAMSDVSTWHNKVLDVLSTMSCSETVMSLVNAAIRDTTDSTIYTRALPSTYDCTYNTQHSAGLSGTDVTGSFVVLCQMLAKYLSVECNETKPDDIDDYSLKYIETYAWLLGKLLRKHIRRLGRSIATKSGIDCPAIHQELVEAITHNRWQILDEHDSNVKISKLVDGLCSHGVESVLHEISVVSGSYASNTSELSAHRNRLLHPSQLGYICMVRTSDDDTAGLKSYLASDCRISVSLTAIGDNFGNENKYLRRVYASNYTSGSNGRSIAWLHNHTLVAIGDIDVVVKSLVFVKHVYPQFSWSMVDGIAESRSYHGRLIAGELDSREQRTQTVSPYSKICYEIPYMNMMPVARTMLSTKIIQKAIGSVVNMDPYSELVRLTTAQRPLVTTTKCSDALYGTNVMVCYTTLTGYGIEDGIAVNKASVERGLFSVLQRTRLRWDRPDNCRVEQYMIYSQKYTTVKQGSVIATVSYVDENNVVRDAKIKHSKAYQCVVSDVLLKYENPKSAASVGSQPRHLVAISVMLSRHKLLNVGDKLSSRFGQKAIAVHMVPAESMPVCLDPRIGGIDIIVDPLAVLSRCTMSQDFSSTLAMRLVETNATSCRTEPFGDTHMYWRDVSELCNTAKPYTVSLMDGDTGIVRQGQATVGIEYYMVLNHMSDVKMRSKGYSAKDNITGVLASGGSQTGVRYNWQEQAALLHGNNHDVLSQIYDDSGKYPYCDVCDRSVDGPNNHCEYCNNLIESTISVSRGVMSISKLLSVLGTDLHAVSNR